MNIDKKLKLVVIFVVALILSIALSRSEVRYNASPCISTSVCDEKFIGTKTVKWLGFPAYYDIHTTFTANEDPKLGTNSQGGDTAYSMILINIIFWMFAISGGIRIAGQFIRNKK